MINNMILDLYIILYSIMKQAKHISMLFFAML